MAKKSFLVLGICWIALLFTSCKNSAPQQQDAKSLDASRIVSLSGTTTEIICALGMEKSIAGTDVTSTYPGSVQQLPKVGHDRNMSAEAILALKPTLVVGVKENIKPELAQQLEAANVKVMLFHLEGSAEGAKELIRSVADSLGVKEKAEPIAAQIDADLKESVTLKKQPRVLFIYARGAGTVMAAGEHSYPNSMILAAGAQNAVGGFENFKPVTSESLVSANPDVILMFDSGLESLGGVPGLLQIPGMAQTNAGKNKQVIEMDGLYLTGFGPRTGKAIAELTKKLNEVHIP